MSNMNDKKDLKKTRRGGFYWDKDEPNLTVTTILSVIDKPALRYWYGQQVYLAVVKDPTLDEKSALAAPYQASEKAKDRGLTVHSIVEAYKHEQEPDITQIPFQYRGYAKAFYRWADDTDMVVMDQERTVFNRKEKYAGTLDLLCNIKNKIYVVDVKTGKDIYPEAFIQTSAYREALISNGQKVDGIAVVLLKEDGEYKFQTSLECDIKYRSFIAAKKLYEGLNEEKLKKVGYL